MSTLWDSISSGSKKLNEQFSKSAPNAESTAHVWCTAFVEGAEKCKCPKHRKEVITNGGDESEKND